MLSLKKFFTIVCFATLGIAQSFAGSITITSMQNGASFNAISPSQNFANIPLSVSYTLTTGAPYVGDPMTTYSVDGQNPQPQFTSPTTLSVGNGNHTLLVRLLQWNNNTSFWDVTASQQISFSVYGYFQITGKNSFGGGSIVMFGTTYNNIPPEGITVPRLRGSTGQVIAINNQFFNNYTRVFTDWTSTIGGQTFELSRTVTVSTHGVFIANLDKRFDITFQNSLVGVGNGGVMKVNSTQYTLPHAAFNVLESNNSIQAEALDCSVNGIAYTFNRWSDGSTVRNRTFTPGDHATYTAIFNPGVPLSIRGYFGLAQVAAAGQNLRLQWTEHSSPGVTQYQVWRKMKQGSTNTEPVLLTTLNRGTTSYTDHTFNVTNGYTDLLLMYDVRAYYATENTYAVPDYLNLFGTGSGPIFEKIGLSVPTVFAMSTYPNPFNPTTTIRFDLPVEGNVSLVIFDLLGRKVADLTDGYSDAGSYSVRWDANNGAGVSLAGGMYLARLSVRDVDGKVRFSAVNKLLLMK